MPASPSRIMPLGLLFTTVLLVGCGDRPPDGATPLHGAGATFPHVLYEKWFDTYHKEHPEVRITYDPVGSSEGVRRFLAGNEGRRIEFGASDNGLSPKEAARVSRGVVQIPTTGGMVAVVYNLPGLDQLKLSREALAGIFLGEIRRWNDSLLVENNPALAKRNEPITLVARLDGSGTTYLFSSHLSALSERWRTDPGRGPARKVAWPNHTSQQRGNEAVGAMVQRTTGSIGYVDFATARSGQLQTAWLQNQEGEYVAPLSQNGSKALESIELNQDLLGFEPNPKGKDAYPIVGFTWIMVYKTYEDSERSDALKRFLEWSLTEGQLQCEREGYVPLPANVVTRALEAVRDL